MIDDGDDVDDVDRARDVAYSPSLRDTLTRWRFTLSPTLYVDENSSESELLWQLVLEQRGNRYWLAIVTGVLLGLLLVVALVAAWFITR